jgi:hypothetical protein
VKNATLCRAFRQILSDDKNGTRQVRRAEVDRNWRHESNMKATLTVLAEAESLRNWIAA